MSQKHTDLQNTVPTSGCESSKTSKRCSFGKCLLSTLLILLIASFFFYKYRLLESQIYALEEKLAKIASVDTSLLNRRIDSLVKQINSDLEKNHALMQANPKLKEDVLYLKEELKSYHDKVDRLEERITSAELTLPRAYSTPQSSIPIQKEEKPSPQSAHSLVELFIIQAESGKPFSKQWEAIKSNQETLNLKESDKTLLEDIKLFKNEGIPSIFIIREEFEKIIQKETPSEEHVSFGQWIDKVIHIHRLTNESTSHAKSISLIKEALDKKDFSLLEEALKDVSLPVAFSAWKEKAQKSIEAQKIITQLKISLENLKKEPI